MSFGGTGLVVELVTDLHGTRASADAGPDFQEEAWVPVNIDLGPPEACTLDSAVLSGRSEKKPYQRSLSFDGFHFFPGGNSSSV